MHDFVFVLEQTLGHVAHSRNLERVMQAERDIEATFLPVDFERHHFWEGFPGLRNWSFRSSWAARRGLKRQIKTKRPNAIFIHTQVAALLATDIMRSIPTVVSLDATPVNFDRVGRAYSHRVSGRMVETVKDVVNRRTFAAAAGLVSWCRWAAESLCEDYGVPEGKIRVIPPGVDTGIFSPDRYGHEGPVRLLFVGGDLERKGGLDLLEALRVVGPGVELDMVTSSEAPRVGPPAIPIRVHRGLKPQSPQLVRLFREADIFVLPSRGDCLPQVIAEAMACALPVITTSVGAIPEVVCDGETGLIVPPGSPRDLARAVAALVADPHRRIAMGRAGLALALRDHDMTRNNRSILAYMTELSQARSLAHGIR
jgi:glycosyltransferase involved in cell wall biosynthesis